MEIPHASKYEIIKNPPETDFLDENLKVSFSIDPEAAAFLPEISDEELETKTEKYRILLGDIRHEVSGEIIIDIKGILEADETDKGRFYSEKKSHVTLNLSAIKAWVKSIQSALPDYRKYHFIGDMHTHPVKPEELDEGWGPCNPSTGDFEDIKEQYDNGVLLPTEPFIFCIAGREGNRTAYAFYRCVKRDGKLTVEQISKK